MSHFLGFILVLFIVAALFRVDFFFYLLYIFFGIFFLTKLWLDRAIQHVMVRREYVDRAFPGERVPVTLHVRNGSLLPLPWLRVHESVPIQLKSPSFHRSILSLLPHEEVRLSYELDCRRRGYYTLGPVLLESGDLFGLRDQDRRLENGDALLVYPRIIALRDLGLPAQTPFGDVPTKQRIFEDPTRLMGIREYQSGDSLRHIHWKATATTGALQVKRFEPAISIESHIFLNLNRDEYTPSRVHSASELAIVTAASIAHHLIEKRQAVGLSCNGLDPFSADLLSVTLPCGKGRAHLMGLLDLLARVQLDARMPFAELVGQASLHLNWGGTAVVITADADDALFDSMILMKRLGFHVALIVTDPRMPFAQVERRASEVGVLAHQVWQEQDLDVWR
ncbi:MAG: DUF58 domain-containing protein [Chloroflexi bacterium]|nr:DUF58 domain-containing protein [Chloroflexota bacterium]